MNRILSCTDGSVYANSICDHTAWAARATGASVHVLHMLDPHRERAGLVDRSGNLSPGSRKKLLQDLVDMEQKQNRLAREAGKLILEEARARLADQGITQVQLEQQHGELVESVTRMERDADLVVVGKRGEAADFARLHLGSNLERVIRASVRPVLVASREFRPIQSFLIAYDGGPSVEKALRFVMESPLLEGLTCHILRAGRIDEKAEWFLQEAAGKLREAGFTVHAHVKAGDPEQVIAQTASEQGVDLLVMGAYGHSRIRQLMVGSTTTATIRTCLLPVLLFR